MKVAFAIFVLSALCSSALGQLTCYSCDSGSDPSCATLTVLPLNSKACADPEETECAVTVFGSRTVRSCKSEIEAQLQIQCTDGNCGLCDSDHCNAIVYPEDRLRCHSYETCDYIENDNQLSICENYRSFDSCYVVVDQVANPETSTIDIITHRGCESTTSNEGFFYCVNHWDKCVTCSEPGCNSHPSYSESELKCYKCEGDNCVYGQEGTESVLCDYNKFLGAEEYCYTYKTNGGRVTRGCLMELLANDEIRKNCLANDEHCQICSGSECNEATTEIDYGECVLCDGATDPNCALLENSYTVTKCGPSEVKGCFRANIHGVIVRSCVSELLPGEVDLCTAGVDCKICEGDLCNAKVDFPVCHECDSRTDPACVDYQTSASNKICQDYMDSCAAYVQLESGATIRGCKKELTGYAGCPAGNDYCVECDRNFCNAAAIPWWRIKCHQCEGVGCENPSWDTIKYCDNYIDEDQCYSVVGALDGDLQVYRGCMSDIDTHPGKQLCDTQGESCSKCSRSECNSEVLETYGQCYLCDGSKDPNCESLNGLTPVYCPQGDKQGCFRSQIDGIVVRGCTSQLVTGELTYCETNGDCKLCDDENCNGKVEFQSCYACDSATDPSCVLTQTSTATAMKTICVDYLDECATYTHNGITYRGCRKELDVPEVCPSCSFCTGADCNVFMATVPSTLSCHICDSSTDPECYSAKADGGATLCDYSLLIGREDLCYAHEADGKLTRGCLYNAPFEVQFDCAAGRDVCKVCGTTGCNSEEIVAAEECYHCNGVTDSNCASMTEVSLITCPKGESQGCFRSQVDGVVVRGCVSQLAAGEVSLCKNGNACKICEGNNCNGKLDFQSCYACDSTTNPYCYLTQADMETAVKKTCTDYIDECVTYTEGGVTVRGCRKELQVPEVCPSCVFCAGGDCNANTATVPSTLHCHVCDSTTDPSCKSDKTNGLTTLCDYRLVVGRGDLCYTHQEGETVSRGCLYNAPFEVQFACAAGTADCQLCGAAGCNSAGVELEDNGSCYFCDGTTDSNCVTLEGILPIECPAGDRKGCFRSQIDNRVARGCVSQLAAGEVALCEAGRLCKICEGDNCNGKLNFQSCYACDSTTNPFCFLTQADMETAVKKTCTDYIDECVTYTEGGVTVRGCRKELQVPEVCPSCVFCAGRDCNSNLATVPSSLRCHVCDSSTDPSCKADKTNGITTLCDYKVVVGRGDLCYTYQEGETLSRGCLYNAPFEVQFACAEGTADCQLCDAAGCNSAGVDLEDNGSCYFCDGTTDSNCVTLEGILPIECPAGDRKGCFRSQIDSKVARGCVSQLAAGEVALCEAGRLCKICEGDNCNGKLNFQSCYTCNSATNPNCVNFQETETSVKTTCTNYLDQCVTYIDEGVTYRGCRSQSSLPATCPSSTCAYCSDGDCNGLIYPSSRLRCQQCTGNAETCMTGQTNTLSICTNYVAGDACYTTITGDKSSVYRGCMSDADEGTQLCSQNGDSSCNRCLLTGCNSVPAVSKSSFSCVKCSTADGNGCGWGYEATEAETCESDVWIGETESCYALQTENGVTRGCTMDDNVNCAANSPTCDTCTTRACNTQAYNKFKCYQCNSKTTGQESCAQKAEGIAVTDCPGDQKASELGCYLWKKEDESVERGCLSTLNSLIKTECQNDDSATCELCSEEGCNNQNAGAAALTALSTMALVLVAFLVWY